MYMQVPSKYVLLPSSILGEACTSRTPLGLGPRTTDLFTSSILQVECLVSYCWLNMGCYSFLRNGLESWALNIQQSGHLQLLLLAFLGLNKASQAPFSPMFEKGSHFPLSLLLLAFCSNHLFGPTVLRQVHVAISVSVDPGLGMAARHRLYHQAHKFGQGLALPPFCHWWWHCVCRDRWGGPSQLRKILQREIRWNKTF